MDPMAVRLSYLNDAAHLLSLSSPAIAAQFQARYNAIVNENDINGPASRAHDTCSACGHNILPSAMYTVSPQDRSRTKPHKRTAITEKIGSLPAKDKTVVLECRACLSKTEIKLAPTAKRQRPSSRRMAQTETISSSRSIPIPTASRAASIPGPATQNSRSKAKRAKSRNSLHAMLAKSKEQAQSEKGFGFGLMDLMKRT
jgi:hypothetical protein